MASSAWTAREFTIEAEDLKTRWRAEKEDLTCRAFIAARRHFKDVASAVEFKLAAIEQQCFQFASRSLDARLRAG